MGNHLDGWSDEKLMSRLMAGDSSALGPLVSRYYAQLLAYAFRLTQCNLQTAEDILQEAFVRLLTQKSFQPRRTLRPWLYRIVTNVAYDQNSHWRVGGSESFDDFESGSKGPEQQALDQESATAVRDGLSQLSDEHRAVLVMRFFQDMSLKETAEALGIPIGTVKSRQSEAARQLRAGLTALEPL